MRRGHGSARDGGDGISEADLSGVDAQAGGEDLSALSVLDITRLGLGRNVYFTPSLPDLPSSCPSGRFK